MGQIEREAGIIATRHIHINEEIRCQKNLVGIKEVSLKIEGEKGGILEHVR